MYEKQQPFIILELAQDERATNQMLQAASDTNVAAEQLDPETAATAYGEEGYRHATTTGEGGLSPDRTRQYWADTATRHIRNGGAVVELTAGEPAGYDLTQFWQRLRYLRAQPGE